MSLPTLSVVIVAHDSLAELRATLPALDAELSPDDELIIVDNASRDALAAELGVISPRARLVSLAANLGFAGGANAGAAAATGELIVLLNPDATVQAGWGAAIRVPWGGAWDGWMGLVLLGDGSLINTSGGVLHFTGFAWAGQVDQPASAAPAAAAEVGFLSGACLAIPRSRWEALGGFDPWYFMYCEDVDLSLRLRLGGGRIAVAPDARVTHRYEFAKGDYKWRWLERNRWATIIRTYPAPLLLLVAPALLASELAVWALAARAGWTPMKAQATRDVLRALPGLLRERRVIQQRSQITPRQFAAHLTATLDSPYFGAVGRQPLVRGALELYWRGVLAVLPG